MRQSLHEEVARLRREFERNQNDLIIKAARNRADRILRRIDLDPDEVIEQRRADLLADVRRYNKRGKRDRIMQQAARSKEVTT